MGTVIPARIDAVVIGSSPLMLLEALELARMGLEVIVFDRAVWSGGAWYSRPMLGFDSVEPGVHLIENRSQVYRYLGEMGVQLDPEGEDSFGILGSLRIPLSMARSIAFFGVSAKAVLSRNREGLKTTLPRMIRSVSSIGTGFSYPRGGARGMIQSLVAKLSEYRVPLILDCEIDEVILDPNSQSGTCRTSRAEMQFDRLYFASRAHCPMRIGDLQLKFRVEPREIVSAILVLPRRQVARFSYVEIIADSVLRRVRNITRFVNPRVSAELSVLCVQIRETEWDHGRLPEEMILASRDGLARHGLVEKEAELLGFEIDRFAYHTIPDGELDRLALKHDSLVGIKTTDFAEDMVGVIRSRVTGSSFSTHSRS